MGIIDPEKQNAARRTDDGARMWCSPSYPEGSTTDVRPVGCQGCSKAEAHNVVERIDVTVPVDVEGGRYGMIPVQERQDVTTYRRLETGLYLWDYWVRGRTSDGILYNAGEAGDNATQRWTVEIVGGGAGYLTVKGRNPKIWGTTRSRTNPDWPLPDPVTGETSRLIWEDAVGALPACGANVEFLFPSVLSGKCEPLVASIDPVASDDEEDVTFTLRFEEDLDLSEAKTAWDAAFPPADGKYYAFLRVEFLRPQQWKDYQAPLETQFAELEVELTTAEEHELLDSAGGPTRILWPDMAAGAFGVEFEPLQGFDVDRLRTERVDGVYHTYIDLTGLSFATATVKYWAVALSTDASRAVCIGQCIHSKEDPSGSYTHGGGPQHCARVESTGFAGGKYHQNCWLPGACDQFSVVDESPGTVGDYEHFGGLWTRAGWIVQQGIPGVSGYRNFSLSQEGGPSVAGLLGACQQTRLSSVVSGIFADRDEWMGAGGLLGERVTWSEEDGAHQGLRFGAFYMRPYSYGGGEEEYVFNGNGTPELGLLANLVAGWTEGKHLAGYPFRYVSTTGVHSWATGGSSMACVNTPIASGEAYVVATDKGVVGEPDLVARLRRRYG